MRKLTCYAWGKPGDWEGLCVDLDIATQGSSFEEVKRDIELAVADFLDYAADLPELDRKSVLSHRAPWLLRMRLGLQYRWAAAATAFLSLTETAELMWKPRFGELNSSSAMPSEIQRC